jgi:hypothetical protein
VSDYADLLEAARKSRLVLVKDLVAALEAEIAENERARAYIKEPAGRTLEEIQATDAKMAEVFGPHDGKLDT